MPVSGGEAHLLARPVSGRCKSCKQGRLEAEKIEEKRIWFGWILEGNRPRPEPFCPACFAHRRCPASYSWSGNLQTFFLVSWCDVKLCWEKGAFGKETVIMEKERKQQTSNSKQHGSFKLHMDRKDFDIPLPLGF
ncbi:uncharacterized protein LOC129639166 isoform X5 [Bubalus kerabau]|uniref:uncharacterized protein LOC129639166 isoform X5 n=1 Tax=Bubalus carabanensis TaxID=3119969 RepID=UPI00244E8494|nr:uncharacterized protein LOC129639166 isoform X5 [Bubalus carabanensis]